MILVDWEEDAKMIVKNFSRKEMERLNAIVAMDIIQCVVKPLASAMGI